MPTIQITGPIVDILGPHPLSLREAFIGIVVEADSQGVAKLRENHPDITRIPDTYEITLADALEAIILKGRDEAALYWGNTVRPYIIYVPYDQASLVSLLPPGACS